MELQKKSTELIYPIILLFVSTSCTQLQILFCQSLSSGISLACLNAFSLLNYVWLFCQVVSFSLGEICYVLFKRESKIEVLIQALSGALILYFLFCLIFVGATVLARDSVCSYLGLEALPNCRLYLYVWIAIACVFGLNSIFFYFISAVFSHRLILRISLVTLVINVLLGLFLVNLFSDKDKQFLAVNLSFLASWLVYLGLCLYHAGKYVRLKLENLKIFFVRAKHMVAGDLVIVSIEYSFPFFVSKALGQTLGGETLAAYNVGFRIFEVALALQWAINFYGMAWISQIIELRGGAEWSSSLRTIRTISLKLVAVPVAVTVLSMPLILRHFFNLTTRAASVIAGATALSCLPTILTAAINCKISIFEKHITKATLAMMAFGIGLPAIYYFGRMGLFWYVAAAGIFFPSACEAVCLLLYDKMRLRDKGAVKANR